MGAGDEASSVGGVVPEWPASGVSADIVRAIAAQAPAVMLVVAAPAFEIVFANRAAQLAAGRPAARLAGHLAADMFAFVDPALLATGFLGRGNSRAVADPGQGATTWWDVSYVALDTAGPTAKLILITAVDVTHHETARAVARAALGDSEARLRAVLRQIPAAIFIIEAPDGQVTFASEMLDVVLGPPSTDMATAKATLRRWAVHKDGSPYDIHDYPSRRALFLGETIRAEPMAFWRSDGTLVDLEMHAGPVRNEAGDIFAAVAVAMDVTARNEAAARLRDAVEARELLLREADHRIKNSLQLVCSLLALQRSRLSDPDAVSALESAIARVMSVSEAHKALHQSPDLRHVALGDMLRDLCMHVGTLNPALTFLTDCPPELDLDTERAIPLGLVVSELLTNAAKYAYPSGAGDVRTTVSLSGGMFDIAVSDAGVGMTASGAPRGRLGSTIVRALAAQIGAEIEVISAPGEGTSTRLRFSQVAQEAAAMGSGRRS